MKKHALFSIALWLGWGCQPEQISVTTGTNETFYVEQAGSSLRVQVRGNTQSDKIILTVHGGPGGSSYYLSHLAQMQQLVEPTYTVAYLDQPMAGASQGNRIGYRIDDIAGSIGKTIAVLKHRYGSTKKIILYSESWGGLIATAFLTTGDNQRLVAGWINSDGPHDFNLMDREIIRMAIRIGAEQLLLGRNVARWRAIVEYCRTNDPTGNYAVSQKLNELLGDAEYLIDTVARVEFNTINVFRSEASANNAPLTALGLNLVANGWNGVERQAYDKSYAQKVAKIRVPLLLLWGKYDFIAPPAVADSLLATVASTIKRKVLLERSGHNAFLQEPDRYWANWRAFVAAR
ncbi:alpha/beta fold hydrolase [Spirosoma arcticum]